MSSIFFSFSFFFHSFQITYATFGFGHSKLVLRSLPRSRTFRLCAVAHSDQNGLLVAPAPNPLSSSSRVALLCPPLYLRPTGVGSLLWLLDIRALRVSSDVFFVPDHDYCLPNSAISGSHHSKIPNRSCAVRDQACKTSSSRVPSNTQRSTQTSSGNSKINSNASENPSSRYVATPGFPKLGTHKSDHSLPQSLGLQKAFTRSCQPFQKPRCPRPRLSHRTSYKKLPKSSSSQFSTTMSPCSKGSSITPRRRHQPAAPSSAEGSAFRSSSPHNRPSS